MSSFETEYELVPFRDECVAGEAQGKPKFSNKNVVEKIERDLATYTDEVKDTVHYRFNYIQWH